MFVSNMRRNFLRSLKKVKIYVRRKLRVGIDAPIDEDQNTRLHVAVRNGDEKEVIELLQRGAHVNVKNIYKATPLHMAVEHGHPNLIDILTKYGAHVEAENDDGSTPMHMINETSKKIECLEKLVECGADINARDQPGNNLLHLVIKSGSRNLPFVKKLLHHGSDVNSIDSLKENCLHTIALCRSMTNYETSVITQAILAAGINVNAKNILAETPLHKAVWGENVHLLRYLLHNGARLDIPNYQGLSPFDLSVKISNVSYRPLHVMMKHVVIKKHRDQRVEKKVLRKIQSDKELFSLYGRFQEELISLQSKQIDRFSECSFYEILCGDENGVKDFVKNEDTIEVLKQVSLESSNFYWEIVDAWNRLLLVQKFETPKSTPSEMRENRFFFRLFFTSF